MKKLTIFLILAITLSLLTGCNSSDDKKTSTSDEATKSSSIPNYVEILDGNTEELVSGFLMDNSDDKLNILTNAYNYKEETKEKLPETPNYIVHEANGENSYYDNWYNIYIYNDKLFIQDIPEKEAYAEYLGINSNIYECKKVKPDKFLTVLNNSKDDISKIEKLKKTTVTASDPNKQSTSYFSILDYKTKKEITKITADSSTNSQTIMDAYNFYTEEYNSVDFGSPTYTVHYVKDDNDENDIWFNVYFVDNELYTERLSVKDSQIEKAESTNEIYKADSVTVDDFSKAIGVN
jgi:hypothetical protein